MLSSVLQHIIDERISTAREMGELAGVSTSTVYRWVNRESQPDFDSIRLLVRHLPDPRGQEALLSVILAGTPWRLEYEEHDLDVNHDGQIDAEDALDSCIESVRHSADGLARLRANTGEDGQLDSDTTLKVLSILQRVTKNAAIATRVLLDMAEQRRNRKLRLAK